VREQNSSALSARTKTGFGAGFDAVTMRVRPA
jgi:hypothetical protein